MAANGRRDPALAAASGLMLGAAFLPRVPGLLAWLALVPFLAALESRVANGRARGDFVLGWVGGAAFFLLSTHWLALMDDSAMTIGWLKYLGWVLGAIYLAIFWGLAAALAGVCARRTGIAARWTFVPAMLVLEELRGSGDLGFPWFQPGYTQHEVLPVLQLASLGGVTLVTTWVLLVNAGLLHAWRARSALTWAMLALLVGLPIGWGAWVLQGRTEPAGPRIALVQGNIPGALKWTGNHTEQILRAFVTLSDSVGRADRPALVVWPETATGSYVRRNPYESIAVAQLAARLRAPVYMGMAHYTFDEQGKPVVWNAGGGWRPDGSLTPTYAKRHLVPFGERVPFQRWLPALGKLDLGQAEWQPGTGPVLFEGPPDSP